MNRAEYQRYLESPAWQARRAAALHRADHRCQVCYSDQELDVHHRTYLRVGCEPPSDLTVLCNDCHSIFHGKLSRRHQLDERDAAHDTLEHFARMPAA